MCSPSFLSHHSVRLCQITGRSEPFGGLPVLILGDFFQLKPVAAQSIYEGMLNYLSNDIALHQDNAYNHGLELFLKFKITILEGNNRAREDPIHADIIHKLRDLTKINPIDDAILNHVREITIEDIRCDRTWEEALIAVPGNRERHAINSKMIQHYAIKNNKPVYKFRLPLKGKNMTFYLENL